MSDLDTDEMRDRFRTLQAAAQAKIAAGGSAVFGKIIAHLGACRRISR